MQLRSQFRTKKVLAALPALALVVSGAAAWAAGGDPNPTIPSAPAVPGAPALPAVPGLPSAPGLPALPGLPIDGTVPALPDLPAAPAVPGVPMPALPDLPSTPALPGVPALPIDAPVPGLPDLPSTPALSVPAGFSIQAIAAISGARQLAALPNGDLLVGTQGWQVHRCDMA